MAVTAFEPSAKTDLPVLLVFPAMGAPARIYGEAAAALAAEGCVAVTVDPRGVGQSGPAPSRRIDYGLDAFLERDWPAVTNWARERYPGRPLVLLGHSLGGMVSALYAGLAPEGVDGLVLLTTSHVHYRHWPRPVGWLVWGNFVAFATLARLLGYFPGQRLGWGSPIARQLVIDWARWGTTGRYRSPSGDDVDGLLARVALPVLSISFSDDRNFGPKRAVDGFCVRLRSAELTRWHLQPDEVGRQSVGHFGHLRDCPQLWWRIAEWLAQVRPA
ncbi:MAG TPA: alpha/beta fold hydrolase [Alphaproteobacteria bacterium]|nr:alpha/beta fold hydrolase [Alphaproteobacteria bacterium]MDP6269633.1 alpha/beta fold hydrolase [Alphaproteobacteria bacterium]MDP7428328.1 alpha/beta fold hydrolase [Alphaproteobacteria bacterium]HJM50316.1 alpha/beta fold hydrolase [Alphaproteobacteria bacterium]